MYLSKLTFTTWLAVATVTFAMPPIDYEILDKRDTIDCKGSTLCNNGQDFKTACERAYNKIDVNQLYVSGSGAGSGVCQNTCGIFVQGNTPSGQMCSARGQVLKNKYYDIRAHGCQACGKDEYSSGCYVKIDWVSGC